MRLLPGVWVIASESNTQFVNAVSREICALKRSININTNIYRVGMAIKCKRGENFGYQLYKQRITRQELSAKQSQTMSAHDLQSQNEKVRKKEINDNQKKTNRKKEV